MAKLVIGCGYLGLRVARRWLAEGERVYALTRSPSRASELRREGLEPLLGDLAAIGSLPPMPETDTVLYAVGFDPSGGASRRQVQVEGLARLLAQLPPATGSFIFVSSTGVYGDCGGQWVDEETPCRPTRDAGQVMLEAEETLRQHRLGQSSIVLRLAGIYGPQRIPRVADVVAGRPLAVSGRSRLNLIHVDDAASVIVAARGRAGAGSLYTVSDGNPVNRRRFYEYLASLLGLAPPSFVDTPSDPERRGGGDKRVSNARMMADLGVELRYPSFKEGLAAVVASDHLKGS